MLRRDQTGCLIWPSNQQKWWEVPQTIEPQLFCDTIIKYTNILIYGTFAHFHWHRTMLTCIPKTHANRIQHGLCLILFPLNFRRRLKNVDTVCIIESLKIHFRKELHKHQIFFCPVYNGALAHLLGRTCIQLFVCLFSFLFVCSFSLSITLT